MKISHLVRRSESLVLSASAFALGCIAAPASRALPATQPKALGTEQPRTPASSLVILPVRLVGRPAMRVSEVIALMLEKNGLPKLDLATAPFEPAGGVDTWADALRDYLRQHPVTADYVLFADFAGSREVGLNELAVILADNTGNVVWTDHKTAADPAFQRVDAREPMTMAALLVEEIGPQFGLDDGTARDAKPGRFTQLMEERSGLPPAAERAAIEPRLRELSRKRASARIAIFPVRIANMVDSESAHELAHKLTQGAIGKSCAVVAPVLLPATRPDPNELRALWEMARVFREHLQKHPCDADYALYADYRFSPVQWERGTVHFVVCDAHGEWVIVDYQNSHHADFQEVRPTSKEDCSELVFHRLQRLLGVPRTDGSRAGALTPTERGTAVASGTFRP